MNVNTVLRINSRAVYTSAAIARGISIITPCFLQASFDPCLSLEMLSALKSFCKNQVKDDESTVEDESPPLDQHAAVTQWLRLQKAKLTRMICLFLCGWLWEGNEDESEFALQYSTSLLQLSTCFTLFYSSYEKSTMVFRHVQTDRGPCKYHGGLY